MLKREQSRLRNFIRRRVPDPRDAEDILQDVFYELVEANRLLMPIEHVTAWLFRVARNRIYVFDLQNVPRAFSSVRGNARGIYNGVVALATRESRSAISVAWRSHRGNSLGKKCEITLIAAPGYFRGSWLR